MALTVNGQWNHATRVRWQQHLKARGFYTGYIDGDFGTLSRKAAQRDFKSRGYYTGYIDGDFGPMTRKSMAHFLSGHWGRYMGRALQSQMYVNPWSTTPKDLVDEIRFAIQNGLNMHYGQ